METIGLRARIEMELEDVPGQLVKALSPISRMGANIQNVVHRRDEKTPLGRIPVTVIFDVDNREKLGQIVGSLDKLGAQITLVGEREAVARSIALLVGHIIDTDMKNTVERLNSVEGVRVSDLTLSMREDESVARIIIEATHEDEVEAALSKLEEIAEEKNLLIIKSLGGFERSRGFPE